MSNLVLKLAAYVFLLKAIGLYQEKQVVVRVANDSEYVLSKLVVYSEDCGELQPKRSTSYITVSYDADKDDNMLYLIADNTNLGTYIIPPKDSDTLLFIIEDIDVKEKMIKLKQIDHSIKRY